MLFYEQPDLAWTPLDFKLLEAYQILDDETCPKCGNPIWLCRNPSNDIEWAVDDTTCYATKALESKDAAKNKKKPTKQEMAEMGKIYFAKARVPKIAAEQGVELPTRSEFYDSLR